MENTLDTQAMAAPAIPLNQRFRGYLPVIVDIETAGFNAKKHALLEIAAVIVEYKASFILRYQIK